MRFERARWVLRAVIFCPLLAACATVEDRTTRTELGEVWFGQSNFEVPESRTDVLDRAVRELEARPELRVFISGHAYDTDSRARNMRDGKRRADAAKAYLVERGIDPSRIDTSSRGDSDPYYPRHNLGGRMQGNRVEVHLVAPLVHPTRDENGTSESS